MAVSITRERVNFDGMVQVGEAARFLGVCKETLRNWDKSGRLKPLRNPITGYRYYKQSDLEAFFVQMVAQREYE